jgi:zinc D-Ala-D-Ala carboxypeptidase
MSYKYFNPATDPRLFFCSHTGEAGIVPEFVEKLDKLREACGFPFVITSGYRSSQHPIEARKSKPGTHSQGIAADIAVADGYQRRMIVEKAIELGFKGIGVHDKFVHVDDRDSLQVLWVY